MKQTLLNALKAKFPGVNANVLNRIAEKLAKTVTTDEQVTTAVAGVTQEFIEIIESYGDSRATEAQQTAVQNYESKYGLKDGQKVEQNGGAGAAGGQAGGATEEKKNKGEQDSIPAWAQALIDSNKQMSARLDKMDSEHTTGTRKQQLRTVIEKLPEGIRKAYERTPVDNLTDEQFNALIGEVTSEVDGIASSLRAKGAVFGKPAVVLGGSGNNDDELTKEQLATIENRDSKPASGQPF